MEQEDWRRAHAELRKRYDDLLNGNLAGIFRTTLEGVFLECNNAMAHMLGYSGSAELMNMNAVVLYFSPEDRARYLEDLKDRGRLVNYEIRLRHKSGRAVFVLENVYLVDEGDGTRSVLGMLMDITALKEAQASLSATMASYRELVDLMQDGLMLVQGGVLKFANPAARNRFPKDPRGASVESLFEMDGQESITQHVRQAEAGETTGGVLRIAGSPDHEYHFTCSPAQHEGLSAVQLTLRDHSAHERLIKERVQLQIAQEVNQVLREEIETHRRTQAELRQSRRFARSLIDSSLDMIMAADEEGRITEYNPAASIRFGYEADEILGKDTPRLYADPAEYARIQSELDRHGAFAGEVRNIDKFGNPFISYLAASRLFDERGKAIGAMGVSRDITRMKLDQEALRASEERYRDLFENASDLIQSVRGDGRFEYVNNAWRAALGFEEHEIPGLMIWDVVHPDHLDQCKEIFRRVLLGEKVGLIRTVFRAKDGRAVFIEGTANLRTRDGRPEATRSIFRDITHELAARQQAQEHEAQMRALFESSEHMFWSIDRSLRLSSFNKGYASMIQRLYGVTPEVNLDPERPRARFASDDYHAFWEEKYRQAFSGQALRFETDRVDVSGERVCNEVFLSPVFGADGSVEEVFGIGHEITEQKVAEDTVREQAARLKAIFESSANMMIWTLDEELRLTSFNEHFRTSIEELHAIRFALGDPFAERMAPRVRPGAAKHLLARYAAALRGAPQQFEVELVDINGDPAWVENFLNPIIIDGRVVEVSCLAYGITDRKQAQRTLEQSLSEKEVLLKEVHHRVKNNLQVISSIAKLQGERHGVDPRVREMLHHSRDRVRSMALIHESLYQTKQFSSIDLADYIDGLARNLMLSYSTTGRVELDLDLEPVRLSIDQAMPCGLILNEVISNALKHAFPDGRQGSIRIRLRSAGDQVTIHVADDGKGLPESFNEAADGGLGLELIQLLTSQLDGRMQRTARSGVSYLLTFERVNPRANGADERTRR